MNTQRIEILKQTKGKNLEDKAIEKLKWFAFEYIQMSEERLREAYLGTFYSTSDFGEYVSLLTERNCPNDALNELGEDYIEANNLVIVENHYFDFNIPNILIDIVGYVSTATNPEEEKKIVLGHYKSIEEFETACEELYPNEEKFIFRWEASSIFKPYLGETEIDENLFLLSDMSYEWGRVVMAYAEYRYRLDDEIVKETEEYYIGEFGSDYEFGEYLVDNGFIEVSEEVRPYFDSEKYGMDMRLDNIEIDGYYFWKYY